MVVKISEDSVLLGNSLSQGQAPALGVYYSVPKCWQGHFAVLGPVEVSAGLHPAVTFGTLFLWESS